MQLEEEKIEAECIHDFIIYARRNGGRVTPQPYVTLSSSGNIWLCVDLSTPTVRYHKRFPYLSSTTERLSSMKKEFPYPFSREDHPIKKIVDAKRSTFEMLMGDLYTRLIGEYGIPVGRNPSLSVIDIRELKNGDVPEEMPKEDLRFFFDLMHKVQKEKYSF